MSKESDERYRKSPKGKAARNKAQQRYRAKNKLSHQAYQKSPKGRAVHKKAVAKYARTAKGIAARQRATINSIIKKSKEDLNAKKKTT